VDWKVLLVIVILVIVAGVTITLGFLLSRANRKRRRAEVERDANAAIARRLIRERENKELDDEAAAAKLSDLLYGWNPDDPPGISGGSGDG